MLDLKKRNAAYQELCDAKAGSDKYVPRSAQTLNPPTKHKSVSATPPAVSHVKLTAEGFAIADAFREQVSGYFLAVVAVSCQLLLFIIWLHFHAVLISLSLYPRSFFFIFAYILEMSAFIACVSARAL